MTTPNRIRASDAERERIATRIQQASTEGRLTLQETEQRLGEVYASTYVDELTGFVADLPAETTEARRRRPSPPPLRLHAAVVVVLSVLLIAAWAASGVPFFWPVAPMFWLGLSLLAHAAFRLRRAAVPY